jgi:hypothetical protein
MYKKIAKNFLLILITLSLAACTTPKSADSGDSDGGNNTDNSSNYSGSASLSGVVQASSSDLAQVMDAAQASWVGNIRPMSAELKTKVKLNMSKIEPYLTAGLKTSEYTAVNSGKAHLFAIQDDGSLKYTEISADLDDAGEYDFKKLKPGNYVVFVVKEGQDYNGNKNVLKLKTFAMLDSGASTNIANLNPITGYILNVIMTQVIADAQSADLDIASIKLLVTTVANSITALIESGVLQLGTNVDRESDDDELLEAIATANQNNDNSDTTTIEHNKVFSEQETETGQTIGYEEDVRNLTQENKFKAIVNKQEENSSGTADTSFKDEAMRLIKAVLGLQEVGTGDNDNSSDQQDTQEFMPDFVIESLAEAWINKQEYSITKIASSIANSLFSELPDTIKLELTATKIQTKILDSLTKSDGAIAKVFAFYNSEATERNYKTIPASLLAAFPNDDALQTKLTNATASTKLDILQALAILKATDIFQPDYEGQDQNSNQDMEHHGPPFDPINFMKNLGTFTPKTNQLYVMFHRLSPRMNHDNIKELEAEVEYYLGNFTESPINKVELEYTDTNGTKKTAQLKRESMRPPEDPNNPSGNLTSTQKIELKNKAAYARSVYPQTESEEDVINTKMGMDMDRWVIRPHETMISDYVKGTVYFKAYNSSGTLLNTLTDKIYKFAASEINWKYPPEDPEKKPFNIRIPDQDGAKDNLKFDWSDAELNETLESGQSLKYALNLEMHINGDMVSQLSEIPPSMSKYLENIAPPLPPGESVEDWSKRWDYSENNYKQKFLWSIFSQNTGFGPNYISGSKFELPINLPVSTYKDENENIIDIIYTIRVRPIVVNGPMEVWSGKESEVKFRIMKKSFTYSNTNDGNDNQGGDNDGNNNDYNTSDFTNESAWPVTLNGTIYFPKDILDNESNKFNQELADTPGSWKIALMPVDWINSNNKRIHFFMNGDPKSPFTTINETKVMQTLGTLSDIKAEGLSGDYYAIKYSLPSLTKDDLSPERKIENYRLMVWYDQTVKSDFEDWKNETPHTDKIDFYNPENNPSRNMNFPHPIEFFEEIMTNFNYDSYNEIFIFGANYGPMDPNFANKDPNVSEKEANQIFNIYMFKNWDFNKPKDETTTQ